MNSTYSFYIKQNVPSHRKESRQMQIIKPLRHLSIWIQTVLFLKKDQDVYHKATLINIILLFKDWTIFFQDTLIV